MVMFSAKLYDRWWFNAALDDRSNEPALDAIAATTIDNVQSVLAGEASLNSL